MAVTLLRRFKMQTTLKLVQEEDQEGAQLSRVTNNSR